MMTATYSPDDNKLRLYTSSRLDPETYTRVKAAGFSWAPKQELFVAPAWTPQREDLLIELAGEIGDEDTSLVERAEERAERFEDYSEKRAEDADRAHAAVAAIADGIPMGQPILVGHHSERHARKDAERIENGMRRAVKMWETSKYWTSRASGAIRHAKYKERPDVRARRIKGLEADQRKQQKTADTSARFLKAWQRVDDPESMKRKDGQASTIEERAKYLANVDRGLGYGLWSKLDHAEITGAQAQAEAIRAHDATIAWASRWLSHLANRLEYERAMLAEGGGTVADKTGPEKGGGVRCWASPRGGWSYIQKVNKVSVTVLDNWGNGGRNFTRTIPFDKLAAIMTSAQVEAARLEGRITDAGDGIGFFLAGPGEDKPETRTERNQRQHEEATAHADEKSATFEAMRETLRAGVQVVTAPQLFPTPPDLARRMAQEADPAGRRVLEPSAGTGNLLRAIFDAATDAGNVRVVAVEVNPSLVAVLEEQRRKTVNANPDTFEIRAADFLTCNGDLGLFDRVVMNPPFGGGQDVAHIRHAVKFLKPGGRLVALCANGPRQQEHLKPLASSWEELPADKFKAEGTGVRVALLTIEA